MFGALGGVVLDKRNTFLRWVVPVGLTQYKADPLPLVEFDQMASSCAPLESLGAARMVSALTILDNFWVTDIGNHTVMKLNLEHPYHRN
jgi:hypothetical protein